MRILLISSNRHDRFAGSLPIRPIPLGLTILLGALRETRHTVHLLDLMFIRTPQPAIRRAIRESSPQLIGISVRNLDAIDGQRVPAQRARSFLTEIRTWIHMCRQESRATVVLGGPAVSLLPQESFAALEPDFILTGDASRTLSELADRLERGDSIEDLPGLAYRTEGEIRLNPPGPWQAPRVAPHYDALDLPRYEAGGYGVAVLAKMWPYLRTHGPTPMSAMGNPIPRPIPELLADLQDLEKRLRVRKVFLSDSGFNVPLPAAKALCRAIEDAGLSIQWATGLQPGHMDEELAHLMHQAGCRMSLLAGPGPLQEPLTSFDRHLTALAMTAEPLQSAGVPLVLTIVFGRPGETRETVDRTLALLACLNPFHVQLSAGVRILPFTPLAEQAKAEGVIRTDGDCLHPVRYLVPDLKDWLPRRLRTAARGRPSWHVV
jgi:hypothetical protein